MRTSKKLKLEQQLFSHLAAERGLSWTGETVTRGSEPEQNAFHFVSCGARLLVELADRQYFPSADKATAKRGAKTLAHAFSEEGGRRASVFLSHALACLLHESQVQGGYAASANAHLSFRDVIEATFPSDAESKALIEQCRAEHEVMRTRVPRQEVLLGIETGTRFHLALKDPEHWGDPDEPETLEAQQRYANAYLRSMAERFAIRLAVGEDTFAQLEDKLFHPGMKTGLEDLTRSLTTAVIWNAVVEEWARYAEIALGPASTESAPVHPLARQLKSRVLEIFEEFLDEQRMPERVLAEIASALAKEQTDHREQWTPDAMVALECIYFGYFLRDAECEVIEWHTFDRETVARFELVSQHDPHTALAEGAFTVAKDIEKAFGSTQVVWNELRDWACEEALERARTRQRLGHETGEGVPLALDRRQSGFTIGYGLRFVEESLSHAAHQAR